jgi:plasmid stability protein
VCGLVRGFQAGYNSFTTTLARKERGMGELVLTDVDEVVLHHLRERALHHGRTPVEEAKVILAEELRGHRPNAWAPVDAICDRLAASGRTFSDSADLLREDRDR